MKVLVAGATGAIGRQLIPLLVGLGHDVVGLSRTPSGCASLTELGATGLRGDVLEAEPLAELVKSAQPAVVINQVTDLAGLNFAENARVRREGTHNLVCASRRAGVRRFISQSIAWAYGPGGAPAREDEALDVDSAGRRKALVDAVVAAESEAMQIGEHVVLRYGMFYGAGTWHAAEGRYARQLRDGTFSASSGVVSYVHVVDAAAAAVAALSWPSGIVNVVDDEPAEGGEWVRETFTAVGVPVPELTPAADWERGADNARLRDLGFDLRFPTWRGHLTSGSP
jgi:nucleoside-diphosphate-sugar epimerase